MSDEIKEIYLSALEWTKTHDNIGGVMGNLIFKDNMPYEEYQRLLKNTYFVLCNKDYITNLQEENERLNNIINELEKDTIELMKSYKDVNAPRYDMCKYFIYKLKELKENNNAKD